MATMIALFNNDIVKTQFKSMEEYIINLRGFKNQLLHNKPNLNRFKTTPDTIGCLPVSGGMSGWFGYYIRLWPLSHFLQYSAWRLDIFSFILCQGCYKWHISWLKYRLVSNGAEVNKETSDRLVHGRMYVSQAKKQGEVEAETKWSPIVLS